MAKRNSKQAKHLSKKQKTSLIIKQRFFVGLMVVGIGLIVISLGHGFLYRRSLVLQTEVMEAFSGEVASDKVVPVRLTIWDMIDVPLELAPFVEGEWVTSEAGGTYLGPSAGIGEAGNMILYGHNRREIFANISVLTGSEEFFVTGSDGQKYRYRVTQVAEVTPDEVELLQPTETHVLTMYTCSGILDSKRLVVRAEMVE